jgi:large subunit ribosomal protein L24
MKRTFSSKWKSSKRPVKQRRYKRNAPLHVKQKFMSAHLSKELIKKYGTRRFPVVKGDKVKVVRGQFKGRENKVERSDHKKIKVYITGIERTKKDGSKSMQPIRPSNVVITELNLDDKKRKAAIERKSKKETVKKEMKKEAGKEMKKEMEKEEEKAKEEKQNA